MVSGRDVDRPLELMTAKVDYEEANNLVCVLWQHGSSYEFATMSNKADDHVAHAFMPNGE